jgi:EAL domain-containing protein (putative c-di-GMP-specific phosphodiesterase class I)/GGDEF domain-containing protein
MLLSELEERERRFKLALRAGIPVVLLISLVFYSTFFREESFSFDMETAILFGSLVFITVYFIYFLMELSVKESLIDQTTQGFNNKAFVNKLKKYEPTTLILLIVKNLSTINENYSSGEVDSLLFRIIHDLNSELERQGFSKSLIARRHGAEFLIAINQKNQKSIEEVFNTFIEKHHIINKIEVDYAFAAITNISNDIEKDILHLRDLIRIEEKHIPSREKVNSVQDAKELTEIETCILHALENKTLLLNFRPILNARTNKIDIYEVSVRLKSIDKGEILPKVYLPIINRLGKGRLYDMALVERILELLPLVDNHVCLSFNLSPFSLRDESFQEAFFAKLKESGVDPSRIIIELYERKTHHNLSGYLKTLNKFRAQGVRIAIDNFGSSNASMEYMKHFQFDIVQFDRDYVTKLYDKNTYSMLNSLVQMAKDLDIITVAKWVDKPEQKAKLIAMGIDYLQGFGIAKAINEKQLIKTYND